MIIVEIVGAQLQDFPGGLKVISSIIGDSAGAGRRQEFILRGQNSTFSMNGYFSCILSDGDDQLGAMPFLVDETKTYKITIEEEE